MTRLLGAVEGGGSKFLCAVGRGPGDVDEELRVPTTTPAETLARVVEFLARPRGAPLAAIGVGMFGPVELDARRPAHGTVLATPKPGWSGASIVAPLAALGAPLALDTDVNGAALAEWRWGAARGRDVALYLTVGTGIGGGAVIAGRPLRGLLHPEMGHVPVPARSDDPFPGVCPFHGRCLEGVASARAIAARAQRDASAIPDTDPVWPLEADYLAGGIATLILALSPDVVVLGGGVLQRAGLLDAVRARVPAHLGGYLARSAEIVAPCFGQRAGLAGAFALAESALSG